MCVSADGDTPFTRAEQVRTCFRARAWIRGRRACHRARPSDSCLGGLQLGPARGFCARRSGASDVRTSPEKLSVWLHRLSPFFGRSPGACPCHDLKQRRQARAMTIAHSITCSGGYERGDQVRFPGLVNVWVCGGSHSNPLSRFTRHPPSGIHHPCNARRIPRATRAGLGK